jgi:hypothetical protein
VLLLLEFGDHRSLESFFSFGQYRLIAPSARLAPIISALLQVLLYGVLQNLIPALLLSYRIKKLEDLWSKSFFRGHFAKTHTRCSVKCLRGDKLFFELIFVVDLSRGLTSTIPCFLCSS